MNSDNYFTDENDGYNYNFYENTTAAKKTPTYQLRSKLFAAQALENSLYSNVYAPAYPDSSGIHPSHKYQGDENDYYTYGNNEYDGYGYGGGYNNGGYGGSQNVYYSNCGNGYNSNCGNGYNSNCGNGYNSNYGLGANGRTVNNKKYPFRNAKDRGSQHSNTNNNNNGKGGNGGRKKKHHNTGSTSNNSGSSNNQVASTVEDDKKGNSSNLVEEQSTFLNEFWMDLHCSVCNNLYNDPRILNLCGHTFCYECIRKLDVDGSVECPSCSVKSFSTELVKNFVAANSVSKFTQHLESRESNTEKEMEVET
jgi:hypothetical protein